MTLMHLSRRKQISIFLKYTVYFQDWDVIFVSHLCACVCVCEYICVLLFLWFCCYVVVYGL